MKIIVQLIVVSLLVGCATKEEKSQKHQEIEGVLSNNELLNMIQEDSFLLYLGLENKTSLDTILYLELKKTSVLGGRIVGTYIQIQEIPRRKEIFKKTAKWKNLLYNEKIDSHFIFKWNNYLLNDFEQRICTETKVQKLDLSFSIKKLLYYIKLLNLWNWSYMNENQNITSGVSYELIWFENGKKYHISRSDDKDEVFQKLIQYIEECPS